MTPGISSFCLVPARLTWNIYPLSAAHSICPGSFHQSSLLPFTFHHRQTLAWLCPNSTMSSAATSINTLTLPLSLRGTLTKPTSRRSCQTFTNMYPVQLEDRIHWIIAKNAYCNVYRQEFDWLYQSPEGGQLKNQQPFSTPPLWRE